MFEKYILKSQENPHEEPVANIGMNIQGNPLISKEALRNILYNFDKYNDQDLYNTILAGIDVILLEIFKKDNND